MNHKTRKIILGLFTFLIAIGAFRTGYFMIRGQGIFTEFPSEWLAKVPFDNWITPAYIGMFIYGTGNMFATFCIFTSNNSLVWKLPLSMSIILLMSLLLQIIILGESYLATYQLALLGFIQLCLSVYTSLEFSKHQRSSHEK